MKGISRKKLYTELVDAWEKLGAFRQFYNEEIDVSKKASDALLSLATSRNIKDIRLLGRAIPLASHFNRIDQG
jgi:5-methylcytosine-specific restriction enzyme B